MFVRSIRDVEKTDFFSISHRLLTEKDGVGFTICHRHRAPLHKQSESLFVLSSEMDCLFDGPVVSKQRITRQQAFFRPVE